MRQNIGSAQRKGLAVKVARRRKNRAATTYSARQSPRMIAKAAAHETYIDQIALDKLNGLESGEACRIQYKKLCAKPKKPEPRQKRRGEPREADTYRGAKRKAQRGTRMALVLKAARLLRGETRSEADRKRASA